MEYTDQELINWWIGLSRGDQLFLLELMCEKMTEGTFAQTLMNMYKMKIAFSPKQIAAIRKWDN
jgi:hypothetical protein